MIIFQKFYFVFHAALHAHFLKQEQPKHIYENLKGSLSDKAWFIQDPSTKQPKVRAYFAGISRKLDTLYFYNMYRAFRGPKNEEQRKKNPGIVSAEIENLILIRSLIYLGMGKGIKEKVYDIKGNNPIPFNDM